MQSTISAGAKHLQLPPDLRVQSIMRIKDLVGEKGMDHLYFLVTFPMFCIYFFKLKTLMKLPKLDRKKQVKIQGISLSYAELFRWSSHPELTEEERKQVSETKDSLMPRPSYDSGRGYVKRAPLSLGGLSLYRKPIALGSIVAS